MQTTHPTKDSHTENPDSAVGTRTIQPEHCPKTRVGLSPKRTYRWQTVHERQVPILHVQGMKDPSEALQTIRAAGPQRRPHQCWWVWRCWAAPLPGMENGATALGRSLGVSFLFCFFLFFTKLNVCFYPREKDSCSHESTCPGVPSSFLPHHQTQKQPRRPSTAGWLNQLQCSHTMELAQRCWEQTRQTLRGSAESCAEWTRPVSQPQPVWLHFYRIPERRKL